MSKLSDYLDTLVDLAVQQGHSSTNDIVYRLAPDVILILAYKEPDRIFPLNGLWLITDPASASYKHLLRRSSKTATSPYANTWSEVTDYDDALTTVQTWDSADLPTPQILSGKGGQLLGKVLARTGATTYDANELVPKSYTDGVRTAMNTSFFTMFNNLNARVNVNVSDIRTLKTAQQLLGSRVDALEVNKATVTGKVFLQQEADSVWSLRHEFGAGSGFALVLSEEGEVIWPETMNPSEDDPDNVLLLTFLEPVSGVAQLIYMPLTQTDSPTS